MSAATHAGSPAHAASTEAASIEAPAASEIAERDEAAVESQTLAGSSAVDAEAETPEDPAVAAMKQTALGDGGETSAGIGKTPSLKGFLAEVTNWAFGPGHIGIQTNFAALEKQLIAANVLPAVAFEQTSPAALTVALPQDRVGAQQLLAHYSNRYTEMKQEGIPQIRTA